MTDITIHAGDNRTTLRELIDQGVRVHSVVTDPPYGLVSVQKRFSKPGSAAARAEGNDGSFARLSGGFMGKAWDGTGIERDPDFWRLIHDILLPGGYVFAFSGSRTGHWQACAMEMAGFIMHPMHGWVFGSGFPKAHNASKAIDKSLGKKGTYDGVKPGHEGFKGRGSSSVQSLKGTMGGEGGFTRPWMDDADAVDRYHSAYIPGTPEAAQWEGWAYGTQAQKPALEPIYLGQKPFSEKTGAANLLKHGVGAVNIAGCRVGNEHRTNAPAGNKPGGNAYNLSVTGMPADATARTVSGRHPANLILDGSPEVAAEFPNDTARFFYHAKAGKVDRAGSKHPTVKPIALMQYLIRHITPPGGVVLDPFAGSGTTAEAARREGFDCILMEAESEYVDFLRERFGVVSEMATAELDIFG